MTSDLRLAIAQSPADLSGSQARLAWLEDMLSVLEGRGIDLLLLPELFLTGYNVGDALRDQAEPADGPAFHAIAGLAQRCGMAIHYGFVEASNGRFYNAATCVSSSGENLGTHRKLLLPPGFEADHFTQGDQITTFELNGVRIAPLICYDVEFPETVRACALQGADLVLVPTALGDQWGVVAGKVVPARAFENGVHAAYANHAGEEDGMRYLGGSCIVSPTGADLARAGSRPEVIVAEISRQAVRNAQQRLPYLQDRELLPESVKGGH